MWPDKGTRHIDNWLLAIVDPAQTAARAASMIEQNDKREAAIKRLRAKRGFKIHVAIYLVVNALIVVVWASSGAGYFWPIWAMLGWGIGLAFHGWSVYLKRISEDEIRREMERDR